MGPPLQAMTDNSLYRIFTEVDNVLIDGRSRPKGIHATKQKSILGEE
jgi:hypothetical protein